MALQIVPVQPSQVAALGGVCYEAFRENYERHGQTRPFPTPAVATWLVTLFSDAKHFYGVAALDDAGATGGGGKPVGSNFMFVGDAVGAIGPISVDPAAQSRGVGRALMNAALEHAKAKSIKMVRLMQDAHNVVSLSLYAELGFEQREAVMMMQSVPAPHPTADPTVKALMPDDIAGCSALCESIYKVSRKNELAWALANNFPAYVRKRGGRITGYHLPGLLGHGVFETEEDALAIIAHEGNTAPPEARQFFLPLSEANLYRAAMKAGHRAMRLMNLMTVGPYEKPLGVWMPSVGY